MSQTPLSEHLFRRAAGRMLAALTRVLGVHNLDLAEDAVQDTLCRALETWKFGKLPDDPEGWLIKSARNRAVDIIRRERNKRRFAPDVTQLLHTEWTLERTVDALFVEHELRDDQLRLMFSCCHPELTSEAQIAVILKLLCGFGVTEIAHAFLSSKAKIEKRISRAKAVLAAQTGLFEVAGSAELGARLNAVHSALYLLFNEGYHASQGGDATRDDLCAEALRLCCLLGGHPSTATAETHALCALFFLRAAQLPARVDAQGRLLTMAEQDRARWDQTLLTHGSQALDRCAEICAEASLPVSAYQIEAAIAATHAFAPSYAETNWLQIEGLYGELYARVPTPVVALSRAIATGEAHGPRAGLRALDAIANVEVLEAQPFVHAARARWQIQLGDPAGAHTALVRARGAARTEREREFIDEQLARLTRPNTPAR